MTKEQAAEEIVTPKKLKKAPAKKMKKLLVINNEKVDPLIPFLSDVISPISLVEKAFVFEEFFYSKYAKPRRNAILAFDRSISSENAFIEWVDSITKKAGVPAKLWIGRAKLFMLKFQTADKLLIYKYDDENNDMKEVTLEEELTRGDCVQVKFDILRYYDRMKKKYAFSFKPTEIYIYENKNKDFFNVDYTDRSD